MIDPESSKRPWRCSTRRRFPTRRAVLLEQEVLVRRDYSPRVAERDREVVYVVRRARGARNTPTSTAGGSSLASRSSNSSSRSAGSRSLDHASASTITSRALRSNERDRRQTRSNAVLARRWPSGSPDGTEMPAPQRTVAPASWLTSTGSQSRVVSQGVGLTVDLVIQDRCRGAWRRACLPYQHCKNALLHAVPAGGVPAPRALGRMFKSRGASVPSHRGRRRRDCWRRSGPARSAPQLAVDVAREVYWAIYGTGARTTRPARRGGAWPADPWGEAPLPLVGRRALDRLGHRPSRHTPSQASRSHRPIDGVPWRSTTNSR